MAGRFVVSVLLAAAAFAYAQIAEAQTFPRLGGYLIGGSTPQLTPARVAGLDVVVLSAYPGWVSNAGLSPQQFIAATKAINPNIKFFLYTDIMEIQNPIRSNYVPRYGQIATVPWYAYPAGTSGSPVSSGFSTMYATNITTYSRVSNGQNYPTWRAQQDIAQYITPNPSADGIYIDNVFWKPRFDADWTLSGSSQSQWNATTQQVYRLGYVSYIRQLQAALGSGKYVAGNTADWDQSGVAVITEYMGVLAGGVMESMIGQSYSYEATSWAAMMAAYTKISQAMAAPNYNIFAQDGSPTDYQGFRYGFTSCLMGDGYFFYDNSYDDYLTFDEYNANLGAPLGAALVFPGAAPWQNGVYRRDFQNGIALVNPKGNGTRTVTLETTYKHFSGSQAAAVNNGQSVTTVTLNDRDGVILMRVGGGGTTQAVPEAPVLTVQ